MGVTPASFQAVGNILFFIERLKMCVSGPIIVSPASLKSLAVMLSSPQAFDGDSLLIIPTTSVAVTSCRLNVGGQTVSLYIICVGVMLFTNFEPTEAKWSFIMFAMDSLS